ncbi:virion structural protein [Vibrio phage BONAISHI]|nr:virion structural protein [Vibrio phage BONAISHI]
MAVKETEPVTGEIIIPLQSLILTEDDLPENKRPGGQKDKKGVDEESLKNILVERTKMMSDVESIYQTNPDIRLAREILVAQTLSPKDLSAIKFKLFVDRSVYPDKVPLDFLEELQTHFTTKFDLESKMPQICGEALMDYGSWSYLFIPPSHIDDIIQGSKPDEISLENIADTLKANVGNVSTSLFHRIDDDKKKKLTDLGIADLTTNLSLLKEGVYRNRAFVNKVDNLSLESYSAPENDKTRTWQKQPLLNFKRRNKEEALKNNPLVYKVPSDCILPIHEPSDPSEHLAYLILIDSKGRIVSRASNSDYAGDLERKLQRAMNDINGNKEGSDSGNGDFRIIKSVDGWEQVDKNDPEEFIRLYSKSVMEPIIEMLEQHGMDEEGINLGDDDRIYRIMLERALEKKETRVLFVPADYVTYMAFNYNASGQGVGLMEQNKFFASLRAILQIADMMNAVTNSVPRTEFQVTLDDTDNDGLGTLEALMHELSRMTVLNFPVGTTNPSDIITSIQKAAYSIKVDGGDKFPNTSVDRSDTQRSRAVSDSDLNDDVKRKLFAGLTVPVEAIDRTLEGETATALILNDLMAAKRAMERQLIFRKGIEDIVRTYSYFSMDVRDLCKKHKISDEKFEDLLWALRLLLPVADTAKIEQQAETFETMERFFESAVSHYITDDMLRGIVGDNQMSREILDDMNKIFVSELMRQWMRQNNILPELEQIVAEDRDENLITPLREHYKAVFKNFGPVLKQILDQANKIDIQAEKARQAHEDAQNEDDQPQGGDGRRAGVATPFGDDGANAFDDDFDREGGFDDFNEPEVPEEVPDDTSGEGDQTEDSEEPEEVPDDSDEEPEEPENDDDENTDQDDTEQIPDE